ncbi:cyclophilin-like protein, partial [Lepidopterella palustris CBS 459.81]
MSTVYNLEPQPTAKVLLQTTAGDIELELFAKQTPLTSRNFLQLCLDGYYDNTIFHRLVPGFIIQGGDPTGTGSGGESSYDGEPFADEFHSRLKYNRRGLLGMANGSKKDDNGSQFFFTLGSTPELTGKNTLFGRVAGDTIYNLMKMGEADLAEEGGERPLYPTKITGAEILVNPFDDMVKRATTAKQTTDKKIEKKKPKRKAGKALLSFGGDDDDDATAAPVIKKAKFNPKLVSIGPENLSSLTSPTIPKPPPQANEIKEIPIRRPTRASPSNSPPPPTKPTSKPISAPPKRAVRSPSPSTSRSPSPTTKSTDLLARTNAQIAELKASMKRHTTAPPPTTTRKKTTLEEMIPATSTRARKRRGGAAMSNTSAEQQTLSILNAFRSKLESATPLASEPAAGSFQDRGQNQNGDHDALDDTKGAPAPAANTTTTPVPPPAAAADEETILCDLHFIANCQSCTSWDAAAAAEDDDDDAGWMAHALTFAKDRLGKDLEWKRKNEEELVVIDPREKAKELKVERRGGRK